MGFTFKVFLQLFKIVHKFLINQYRLVKIMVEDYFLSICWNHRFSQTLMKFVEAVPVHILQFKL